MQVHRSSLDHNQKEININPQPEEAHASDDSPIGRMRDRVCRNYGFNF
jgi:hypothetical protein